MKLINKISKAFAVVTVALLSFSCENDSENIIEKYPTIAETLEKNATNDYSVLVKALKATQLYALTTNPGSYTLFAPNNASFATYATTTIPAGTLVEATDFTLLTAAQLGELKRVLMNHFVVTGTLASDLPADGYIKTYSPYLVSTSIGLSAYVNKTSGIVINGGTTNGGTKVTTGDINASNGVIHYVESVMKLPTLVSTVIANPNLSTLLTVVTDPAQAAVLTQLTTPTSNNQLFAPNNSAFTTALAAGGYLDGKSATDITKVLRYHIATSGSFTQTAIIGTSTGNVNNGASSATSFLPTSATTDATVTTRVNLGTSTTVFQTFRIEKNSVKLFENPALTIPASNIKTVNIHTSNGIIHIIDRVLQPVL